MKELSFHEAADIFPLMTGANFDGLVADIREHGQREPIAVCEGNVLDGRNRYRACLELGIKCATVKVAPDDPVAYVVSLNLHRRHLSTSQRGLVAARLKAYYEVPAKERQRLSEGRGKKGSADLRDLNADAGKATDQAGAALGVSGRTVEHGVQVLSHGVPELVAAVDADKIAISTAAKVVSRSPEFQREYLEKHYRGRAKHKGHLENGSNRQQEPELPEGVDRGPAIDRAHDAINQLRKIRPSDPMRKRAFQIVSDWIKANR